MRTAPPGSFTVFDPTYTALAGVHRIQRVPAGEKNGRRHSSTVTVAVLDDTGPAGDVHIPVSDVRVDLFRASGNGGQHRNKTDSAVRLTHLPTGTVVTAVEDRSQHVNRKVAWERLRVRLQTRQDAATHDVVNQERRSFQGGAGAFVWTAWRDEVRTGAGVRESMKRALSGRLGKLMK